LTRQNQCKKQTKENNRLTTLISTKQHTSH